LDNDNDLDDDELFKILDELEYLSPINQSNPVNQSNRTNQSKQNECAKCMTDDKIVEDTTLGIVVCSGCGSVISTVINEYDETRNYNEDNKDTIARCSNPTNYFLPQSSIGTTIAGSNRSKIKIIHSWSAMPYSERTKNNVFKEISHRCQKYGIYKCIEDDAKILYNNICDCRHPNGRRKGKKIIIRGSKKKSLIAACVFYACKRNGRSRCPKEIGRMFELKNKDITKGCKIFLKLIRIKKMQYDLKSSRPEHFIHRCCKELHIPNVYIEQALKIAKNIEKLNIASMHTSFSVALGSISLIIELNNLKIDKKYLAKKFDVSVVTVNKASRKIQQYKNIIVNDELVDKLSVLMALEKVKMVVPNRITIMYKSSQDIIDYSNVGDLYGYFLKNKAKIDNRLGTTNQNYANIIKQFISKTRLYIQ